MQEKRPDRVPRRIAVILGSSGSGQRLLDVLRPLLGKGGKIDLQGVFIEEDELRHVAALPFVKELCRLTLSLREFHSTQLERDLTLRTRIARRAVGEMALNTGVTHTFRTVRGSAVNLLRETARSADITFFAPLRLFTAVPISLPVLARASQQRILVAIDDLATSTETLITAALLAEGEMRRISVLLTGAAATEPDALHRLIRDLWPTDVTRVLLQSESGIEHLSTAALSEGAGMLVLGASEALLQQESLQFLRKQLRCPVCLVRRWGENNSADTHSSVVMDGLSS